MCGKSGKGKTGFLEMVSLDCVLLNKQGEAEKILKRKGCSEGCEAASGVDAQISIF